MQTHKYEKLSLSMKNQKYLVSSHLTYKNVALLLVSCSGDMYVMQNEIYLFKGPGPITSVQLLSASAENKCVEGLPHWGRSLF